MHIKEAAAQTGISKKAIYLYEEKHLLKVARSENGYRTYTAENLETLGKIKLLRLAGVPIADIQLLFDRVITLDELAEKRKKEIEAEYGAHSDAIARCNQLVDRYRAAEFAPEDEWSEELHTPACSSHEFAVGLDIGTTTVSAAVIDRTAHSRAETYSVAHDAAIRDPNGVFFEQDTVKMWKKARAQLDAVLKHYPNTRAIGLTGQMHGIVYLNADGQAVSPLITWQDRRGDCGRADETTYCEYIRARTGWPMATGYGIATHFYNFVNGQVPPDAVTFCDIADYVAMQLTGRRTPLIHTSMAASFGLFDLETNAFCVDGRDALGAELGLADCALPAVTDDFAQCGTYGGIPVAVAIGDNPASFLGSAADPAQTVLVNIGTGSQISALTNRCSAPGPLLEVRPLVRGKYLLCGSALSGGRAYAMLERFFHSFCGSGAPLYERMNQLAAAAYAANDAPVQVDTCFCGRRDDPRATGAIHGLTEQNFTPGQLILGFLAGISRELYDMFAACPDAPLAGKRIIAAAGNAVRKNPVMQKIISDQFGMPVQLPEGREEAAAGAALFGAVAAGLLPDENAFGAFVHYEKDGDSQKKAREKQTSADGIAKWH